MSTLLQDLAATVGEHSLLTGADLEGRAAGIWRSDTISAQAMVRPQSTAEVAKILARCNAARQPVVAHGGRTGLVESHITNANEVILSLEGMNAIEEINVQNRTATVQAGVILSQLQQAVTAEGLYLGLDLGGRDSCTIGGNIATNAGGNCVLRYGMTREQILGLEAVLADGRIVSSMNRMLKNNAGYDLKQLFIGTEGTLGIVTRCVVRLLEQPLSRETALVSAPDFASVTGLLKLLDQRLGGTLSSFEVMWRDFYDLVTGPSVARQPPVTPDQPFYVLLEAQGGDVEQDRARMEATLGEALEANLVADVVLAQSESQRLNLWAVRDDVEQVFAYAPVFIFDVSLPVSDMAAYVEHVQRELDTRFAEHRCFTFGHIGDGNIHFLVNAGPEDGSGRAAVEAAVYGPLRAVGGSVSAEHGIGLEKKAYLDWCRTPVEIDVMRTLKQAFDPNYILNPGKIFDRAAPE